MNCVHHFVGGNDMGVLEIPKVICPRCGRIMKSKRITVAFESVVHYRCPCGWVYDVPVRMLSKLKPAKGVQ